VKGGVGNIPLFLPGYASVMHSFLFIMHVRIFSEPTNKEHTHLKEINAHVELLKE